MIPTRALDRLVSGSSIQARVTGALFASKGRVGAFSRAGSRVETRVRGEQGEYDVALWMDGGRLAHRCSCPSWRDPCKHQVAAAVALRRGLDDAVTRQTAARPEPTRGRDLREAAPTAAVTPGPPPPPGAAGARRAGRTAAAPSLDDARVAALEERRSAGRKERHRVTPEEAPYLRVEGTAGFTYRVHLRGGAGGPHGCDCPDFEANRLHTCKHVESVRDRMTRGGLRLPAGHRRAAARPRVYLHFGERIEPRLLGEPSGEGSRTPRAAFDGDGAPRSGVPADEGGLRQWLRGLGEWVEPEANAWLDRRASRRPILPGDDLGALLPELRLKPYPYQWAGAAFLARTGRALLADEMGLGKTVQAILAAAALRRAVDPVRSVTIVCPASLRGGWQDEIRRWLGEDATPLEGIAAARAATIASRPRWLITHYEQVVRDVRQHAAHPPDLLVIDEAQRAKGLRTRTARVLKAIDARCVFALTGTPLENRLEEAYAIAQLIDQRLLPPLWRIENEHFVRDEGGRRVVLYRNLDALRSRLAPAFLRRRKEDVSLDLPERIRSIVRVPIHPAVRGTYEDVMAQARRIAAKKVITPQDLERMQRLLTVARRCCDGPHMIRVKATDREIPKLAELEDALQELCLGERRKAVVFSEWTDMTGRVEALCERLRLPVFHLRGDVPVSRRPGLIRAFTGAKGPAVFLSTDAGGVGLNLQAADVVINLDLPWNPARLEQRIARVHRIGSRRPVQILLLVTEDSLEAGMLGLHETKRNVLENIWATAGEDVIAAPGGSGAFREMVRALVGTAAGVPLPAAGDRPASGAEIEAITESGAGPGVAGSSSGQAGFTEESAAVDAAARKVTPRSSVMKPVAEGDAAVDVAALSTAIAAVAPTLPADHRRSLATVFRALAAALEPPAG